jgi:hypothetical protein
VRETKKGKKEREKQKERDRERDCVAKPNPHHTLTCGTK